MDNIGTEVTSAIGFLTAPDAPSVPRPLRGHRVVHLSAASVSGPAGFAPLLKALAAAPRPVIDTTGPCDAQRLAGIHLDPPVPIPALGGGHWLTGETPAHVLRVLATHGLDDDAPLSEIEIRHVASDTGGAGALTRVPGPYLLHAVGAAAAAQDRLRVQPALDAVSPQPSTSTPDAPPCRSATARQRPFARERQLPAPRGGPEPFRPAGANSAFARNLRTARPSRRGATSRNQLHGRKGSNRLSPANSLFSIDKMPT